MLHAINNGIKHGSEISSFGVLGNVAALMLLVIVSAIGLGALLVASEFFFLVLKIIGAIYLFYLGIKLWVADLSPKAKPWLEQKNTRKIFNRLTGATFIGFGVALGVSKNGI